MIGIKRTALAATFCTLLLAIPVAAASGTAAVRTAWPRETLSGQIAMVDPGHKLVVIQTADGVTYDLDVAARTQIKSGDTPVAPPSTAGLRHLPRGRRDGRLAARKPAQPAYPASQCQLIRAKSSVALPAGTFVQGLSSPVCDLRRKHQAECANAPAVLYHRPEQLASHSTAPRFRAHKQIIQDEYPSQRTGGEAGIQLSESNRGRIRKSDEDNGLAVSKTI